MRDIIRIVEDGLAVEPPTQAWRDDVVTFAQEKDSGFTALHPDETGLAFTVYASEDADYPAIVVDSVPGVHFYPSPGSKAYRIGEQTGDPLLDAWVTDNLATLRAYSACEIDTRVFNQQMRPIR